MVTSLKPALSRLRSHVGQVPALRQALLPVLKCSDICVNVLARHSPRFLRPNTALISFAVTSHCNFRCHGCRYGRGFMTGAQIDLSVANSVIDDGASLGIRWVRFYGGEPLVHCDLRPMIEHATERGLKSWISTNASLLDRSKFKDLHQAGLKCVTIGLYGIEGSYDWYVQKAGAYQVLLKNLEEIRSTGAAVDLHLSWLLAAHTCSVEELSKAWELAKRFDAQFRVDLVHQDGVLPYFTEGPNGCLRLDGCSRRVKEVTAELERLRHLSPNQYKEPTASIRSIPDWIIRGKTLDVPCDMYKHIWIGPDGSVRLCYAAFPPGNINSSRLADLLYTSQHEEAAQSAFMLDCPRCQCNRDSRIKRDIKTRMQYGWS